MKKTKGLVLNAIKYGDTSAIVQVYTQDYAVLPLMIKGLYGGKNKKLKAICYAFTEIEFSFKPQQKSNIVLPSNLQASNSFYEMHRHPIKSMMLQFIAEVVYQCVKHDDVNPKLYAFLFEMVAIFNDKKEHFSEFHLFLFLKLTSHFGFYPNQENAELAYFDLLEGRFSQQINAPTLLSEEETKDWKKLLSTEFTANSPHYFNKSSRQRLTDNLMDYLSIHLDGFKEPKSLLILKEVLRA